MSQYVDFEDDDRIGPVCWCGGCADDPCSIREHEAKAYTAGWAWCAAIIGMAEAIQGREAIRPADVIRGKGRAYAEVPRR